MKLTFSQYGGFAAGIRRPTIEVDSETLSEPQATELEGLLAAVKEAAAAPAASPGRARDALSYQISIEDGGALLELSGSDDDMTPGFAALLDWLHQTASKRRT